MRAATPRVRGRYVAWIALAAVCATLFGVALSGCGTQEGNGGIPVQTVQPPGGSVSPTATVSPTQTGGPSPTATATESPTATPGDEEGARLFAANCESCHGDHGQGGIGPDLRGLTTQDEPAIVTQIMNGGGGMPAFGDLLAEAEIEDVAAYVADLQ